MHTYIITDRVTEERTSIVAPNRDAALKAYVKRRLIVARIQKAPDELWKRVDQQPSTADPAPAAPEPERPPPLVRATQSG